MGNPELTTEYTRITNLCHTKFEKLPWSLFPHPTPSHHALYIICLLNPRWRDDHISLTEERTMEGFKERVATYTDKKHVSAWIGQPQFWVASFYGLTWPYRWFFQLKTAKTKFFMRKTFYIVMPSECSHQLRQFGDLGYSTCNKNNVGYEADDEITASYEQTVSDTDRLISIPVDVHSYGSINTVHS